MTDKQSTRKAPARSAAATESPATKSAAGKSAAAGSPAAKPAATARKAASGRTRSRAAAAPARQYVYAFGGRAGRRRSHDARPAGRQGSEPGRDDAGGPAGAARVHHLDRGVHGLLRAAPPGARGHRRRDGPPRRAAREADGPPARRHRPAAAGVGPVGLEVLDARHDGHHPQPRPQRPRRRGPEGAHGQRPVRVRQLPPLHPDVRQRRAGDPEGGLRGGVRRGQGAPRRRPRHRARRDRPARGRRPLQGGRHPRERRALPAGRAAPASHGPRRRVPLVAEPARQGVPAHLRHPGRHRDGRQRAGDGLRQHRRPLRHRRRVHAQPGDRRERVLRRVPDQRAGRGRRGRHPHAAAHPRARAGDAARLRGAAGDHEAPGAALPGRAGLRVHHRGREALHAPDAERQAHRPRRGGDRHRPGRREGDRAGGRGAHGRPRRADAAPGAGLRPGRLGRAAAGDAGAAGVAGRGLRRGGLHRRRGGALGGPGPGRAARAQGDGAGRHPRHARRAGRPDRDRRHDLARRRRRPPDGQAVGGRGGRAARLGGRARGDRQRAALRAGRLRVVRRAHRRGEDRPRGDEAERDPAGARGESWASASPTSTGASRSSCGGPTRSAASASAPTPTSRTRRPPPTPSGRAASASAAPSTCSSARSGSPSSSA